MVPRKILLDECVQQAHIPLFPDCFKVEHTAQMGWSGLVNGELIRKAEKARFDVIITEDEGFFGERLDKTSRMSVSVFAVTTEELIASNLPKIIPNICARLLEGIDKPLYVMGGKRSIAKITKGLPPNSWEEVPQDYMTEKYSRRYM